jgi:toxin ParE1/3/4
MTLRTVISSPAQQDVADLASYLDTAAGTAISDRVLKSIHEAVRKLGSNPTLGHIVHELDRPDLRFYLVKSYFIVYRVRGTTLEVIRVLHAARDIVAILSPR